MSEPTVRQVTEAVETIRRALVNAPSTERILLIDEIMSGYCDECGQETGGKRCHCTNDE